MSNELDYLFNEASQIMIAFASKKVTEEHLDKSIAKLNVKGQKLIKDKISQARKDERIKTLEEAMKVVEGMPFELSMDEKSDCKAKISQSATHQALLELRNKE